MPNLIHRWRLCDQELVEIKSKHDAKVKKLNIDIIDSTFRPPSLDKIHIPEMFDKGGSPPKTTGSNKSLEEQLLSLKAIIQKLQVEKQDEEEKS